MGDIIKLVHPINKKGVFRNTKIASVKVRRVKARDYVGLDIMNNAKLSENMVILTSRLTGLTTEEVLDLDLSDYNRLVRKVNDMVTMHNEEVGL